MSKSRTVAKLAFVLLCASKLAFAQSDIKIPISLVSADGKGEAIGSITVTEQPCGVLLKPDLKDLPPGVHGFHIHEHPSCADKAMAAGGHYDPAQTGKHEGPYTDHGHQGDLPVLVVDKDGRATLPVNAPNIKFSSLAGHALVIHAGGDNYSDQPEKLGGGGERIACGVIEK